MATQGERRAQTRRALLDAAAELFAERGVDGASIDAIADAADRTSGAIYDHFGGKEGLLFALLEGWVDDVAAVIGAELATATSLDEQLAAALAQRRRPRRGRRPLDRPRARAVDLRRPQRRTPAPTSPARYRAAWAGIDAAEWAGGEAGGPASGPAVIGLLLGLEMMRRIDPDAVTDELAVAALRGRRRPHPTTRRIRP